MTVSITVRNVADETRDALAARAAASGRSLQEYLSAELRALAARPSVELTLERIRTHARTLPDVEMAELVAEVEADRR